MRIKTIQELKDAISREIDIISENGIVDEHGNWTSKRDEEDRLRKLHSEICYFMREYGWKISKDLS